MSDIPAHIASDGCTVHTIEDHSRKTAEIAASVLRGTGLMTAAYLSGLIHDMGKATFRGALTLRKGALGEESPDGLSHTYAAVRYILTTFHSTRNTYDDLASEMIAYAAGAHHSLFDLADGGFSSGFSKRIEADGGYAEAVRNFFSEETGISEKEVKELFRKACKEMNDVWDRISFEMGDPSTDETWMYTGLTARLLLSAVIEGDRRDTAHFFGLPCDEPMATTKQYWQDALSFLEEKVKTFPQSTDLQKARRAISYKLRRASLSTKSLFTLTLPPGAGRTISSLRFALSHAAGFNKRRIIWVTPMHSEITRTAELFSEYLPKNIPVTKHYPDAVDEEDDAVSAVTWNAPVVITGFEGFLMALHSGRTSSVRRFSAMLDSIVIIEEVESLPQHLLPLFVPAINFLMGMTDTTVLLSSIVSADMRLMDARLSRRAKNIVRLDESIASPFRRTRIVEKGSMPLSGIPRLIRNISRRRENTLVLTNTPGEALFLHGALRDDWPESFHFSSRMCPLHLEDTRRKLTEAMKEKDTGILAVSDRSMASSLHLSFRRVITLTSGIEDTARAEGLSNTDREFTRRTLPVYTVTCTDEDLSPTEEHRKEAAVKLMEKICSSGDTWEESLMTGKAARSWWDLLLKDKGKGSRPEKSPTGNIFTLLSSNRDLVTCESSRWILQQAFATAGRLFITGDEETVTAVAPYGDGDRLLDELRTHRGPITRRMREIFLSLGPYTVTLRKKDTASFPRLLGGRVTAIRKKDYHPVYGWKKDTEEKEK